MAKSLIIKLSNVTKKFHLGKNVVPAVNDISIEIRSGEYIILYGPSGCGKSTLLNIIAGLERPSAGQVIIRGEDLYRLSQDRLAAYRRVKLGIVFQQFNLIHSLTALENVEMPLVLSNVDGKQRQQRASELLDSLGLAKQLAHRPNELSGGQQQRVAIARALINHPWILLCDEPTGNVDSKAAQEIMELFFQLNKESKRTILLVTHNPDHLHYADRVLYMRDGQIFKEEKVTLTPAQQTKIAEHQEIRALLRKYSRRQLNDMAVHYGLHGESFRNRQELASAILRARGESDQETEARLKTILSATNVETSEPPHPAPSVEPLPPPPSPK